MTSPTEVKIAAPIPGSHLRNYPCSSNLHCGNIVLAIPEQALKALCGSCRITSLGGQPVVDLNACICGATTNVHPYPGGPRCQRCVVDLVRKDWYGFAIPRTWTQYDPTRLDNITPMEVPAFLGEPPRDSPYRALCWYCTHWWPLHDPAHAIPTLDIHERRYHRPHGWMVGGAGGLNDRVCAPCGGESPGGTILIDGKTINLPQKGEPLSFTTHAAARHDLCLKGKKLYRDRTISCECRHRTPDILALHQPAPRRLP